MRIAPIFSDDVAHAGDDRWGVWLCKEIDLDFDALSDLVGLFGDEQNAGDAEIQHLPGVPRPFGNGADARRPFNAMPAGTALLRMSHHKTQSKNRARRAPIALRVSLSGIMS